VCCGSYFYSQYDNDVDLIIFKGDGKPPASLMHEETMSNPLLSLLDIDYPLIQAPMAGVSTPRWLPR
jgi:nitronate monooxygenase